jgi:hypothetical protein
MVGAVLCLVVPLLGTEGQANAEGQANTTQQPQRPGVQVGVPEGHAGGGARQGGFGRGRATGPALPAPRSPEGRVLLGGATPRERNGVWLPSGGGPVTDANMKDVPFQPWARAVLADRVLNELEPHTRCKPSGVTRPFLTPYGVEFVDLFEYVCQQMNYAHELMVGSNDPVDRRSPIIP